MRGRANWSQEHSTNNAQRQHGNNPPITHLKLHAEWPLLSTTRNTHQRQILLHARSGEIPTPFIKTTLLHEKTTSNAAKRAGGVAMKQNLKQPQTKQHPPHTDSRGRDTHLHHDLHAEHKQDDHPDISRKKNRRTPVELSPEACPKQRGLPTFAFHSTNWPHLREQKMKNKSAHPQTINRTMAARTGPFPATTRDDTEGLLRCRT